MKLNRHIRKLLFIAGWSIVGVGVLVLLVAAIRTRKDKVCDGYEISLSGKGDQWFMNKKEVVDILTNHGAVALKGRALQKFDLRGMEDKLRRNVWIKDAELFFDNNEILQVKIDEREPIARLFTLSGNSFYIDSNCVKLPLSEKISAKLPVFTGFPSDNNRLNRADSALLRQVKQVSVYIRQEPFWMAQITQVDITPERKFEMIPMVGNHLIEFGDGTDFDKKFARLLQFYKLVLSKTGMDRYERINVQYERQVIGVKKGGPLSKVDSLKAARNIQQLINLSQTVLTDSINRQQVTRAETLSSVNNAPAKKPDTEKPPIPVTAVPDRTNNSVRKSSPVKSQSYETSSKPVKKPVATKPPAKQPKAVMPKKKRS
jgi:cell division protein FtsQ